MDSEYGRDSEAILEDLWDLYDVANSDDRSFNRIMIYPKHLLWREAKVQDKIESSHSRIVNRPVVVASFNTYEEPMILHVLNKPTDYETEKSLSNKLANLINELIQAYVVESSESTAETSQVKSN
ncbi:hypothetical protein ACNAN0_05345 [Agrilactobacillus fermenti]|uniref:hypothetical protein n=1 Tax=Agrilactobacillus fermenti TaxID=2586909 RepID=UPI001E42D5E7|nr:hypothetical protein [Agrilactobacillus fermenti]MCD2257034.1 hypothetical protein [Agrilactobacillus fermenti]